MTCTIPLHHFLVNNGRKLYEIQQILGHSSARMTELYAHLAKIDHYKQQMLFLYYWMTQSNQCIKLSNRYQLKP
jgi:hypothetical protein